MKPWREVLAERGWTVRENCGVTRSPHDGLWWVYVTKHMSGDWWAWVDEGDSEFAAVDCEYDTEDAAFAALMAKPIGPGQVIYVVPLLGFWNGTMQDNQDNARSSLRMAEALKSPHAKAFKAAIAYAWPKGKA